MIKLKKTLDAGFEDLKKLLPVEAFYGRGAERGPELIMTDDDSVRILHCNLYSLTIIFTLIIDHNVAKLLFKPLQALMNALRKAWPEAVCLQCQWHILQVIFLM